MKLSNKFQSLTKIQQLKPTQILTFIVISTVVIVGFCLRILAVFQYTTFDIGPDPDQIRDGFIIMDIWQGKFPHLGPVATGGKYGYSVPPLYYYLVFPFTILGSNPVYQALANATFSFISIILLMILIVQLLEQTSWSKRLLLSGLAGLWYSTIFPEIFINTYTWNPSPIPCFLILFILLYNYQLNFNKSNFKIQALSWSIWGIILAILVSLHSTTLFIMPIVFILSSGWYIYQSRKDKTKWIFPVFSLVFANLALGLYWKLEISRNFINTQKILETIFKANQETGNKLTIFEKLIKILIEYYKLGNQAYFLGDHWIYKVISFIFLSLVSCLGLYKFRGNKTIMGLFCLIWLLYLYAVSNFQYEYFFIHYKLLILLAPIILAITTLAYLDLSKFKNSVLIGIILVGIGFSLLTNLNYDFKYLASKYGSKRVMSTGDIINLFNQIPEPAVICYPDKVKKREKYNQYDYINTYVTQKNFQIVNTCQSGQYVIHPKYKMDIPLSDFWPRFKVVENKPFKPKAILFLETKTAFIYRLD